MENYTFKALEINKYSETGYIFGTKNSKPVEAKGISWAPPRQVEVKCPPPPGLLRPRHMIQPVEFDVIQYWRDVSKGWFTRYTAIIYQQLVAMLQVHIKFVHNFVFELADKILISLRSDGEFNKP